jgi:hypothetical protein
MKVAQEKPAITLAGCAVYNSLLERTIKPYAQTS